MGALKVVTPPGTGTITVTFGDRKQTIDGFGCANAAIGLTSALADLFFSTSSGIGLSLFRVPFSQGGSGPFEADATTLYADAAFAVARGAKVWAAPWTATPAAWKTNNNLVGGLLSPGHFGDWSATMCSLQAAMVANSAGTLYGLSVGNEPDLGNGGVTYESMGWTAADMATFIKANLGPGLAALSPRPLLIAPECSNWDTNGTFLSTLLTDSAAAAYIDVVATHQYAGTVAPFSTTKRVWQTEMSDLGSTFDASMTNALGVAAQIHSALTTGNVAAWHAWLGRNNHADDSGLIGFSSDDALTKRLYALGNWSKFVRPGWVRIGTSGSIANVSVTAFEKPSTGEFAVVAVNSSTTTSGTVAINGLSVATVTPWLTSASANLAQQADVPVAKGVFTASLAASSVTTFVGTGS